MARYNQIGKVATSVFTKDGWTEVIYHETCVVKFNSEQIILNTGGWKTNTTRVRMNQASQQFDLGYSVYQKSYEWFVDYKGITQPLTYSLTLDRKDNESADELLQK